MSFTCIHMILFLKGFFSEFDIVSISKCKNFESRQFQSISAKFSEWGSLRSPHTKDFAKSLRLHIEIFNTLIIVILIELFLNMIKWISFILDLRYNCTFWDVMKLSQLLIRNHPKSENLPEGQERLETLKNSHSYLLDIANHLSDPKTSKLKILKN